MIDCDCKDCQLARKVLTENAQLLTDLSDAKEQVDALKAQLDEWKEREQEFLSEHDENVRMFGQVDQFKDQLAIAVSVLMELQTINRGLYAWLDGEIEALKEKG